MGLPELRKELKDYIDHADERFLKMVKAMSLDYTEEPVVGYNANDKKEISEEELKQRVNAASKRVKNGDFISHEDMEGEVENW